jgi:DNA mismatch endonuclease (patch repair protein)
MRATPRRDTPPELALRRELHRRGLRYRLHQKLLPGLRREVDIAFPRVRVAVFVDGCFWHACPEHGTTPKSNREWWQTKLEANRSRDRDTDKRLRAKGWHVVRIWEHELPMEAADRIESLVRSR